MVLDKDRELGEAQAEIKALKLSERAREKAVEEVNIFTFVLHFVLSDISLTSFCVAYRIIRLLAVNCVFRYC